jgi:hypothetical protein
MIDFPKALLPQYLKLLEERGVPAAKFAECIKWSRYFLDFFAKYATSISQADHLPLFIEKLKTKRQSELQCRQATYAVSAFFTVQNKEGTSVNLPSNAANDVPPTVSGPPGKPPYVPARHGSQYSEPGFQEKSDSPEWDAVLASMADEIMVRHYSRKTLISVRFKNCSS